VPRFLAAMENAQKQHQLKMSGQMPPHPPPSPQQPPFAG